MYDSICFMIAYLFYVIFIIILQAWARGVQMNYYVELNFFEKDYAQFPSS